MHDRVSYRPGAQIDLVPVNRSHRTVAYGFVYRLYRRVGGVWSAVPLPDGQLVRLPLLFAAPGRSGPCVSVLILSDAAPGRYRVTVGRPPVLLRGQFRVAGRPLPRSAFERDVRRLTASVARPLACRDHGVKADVGGDGRVDRVAQRMLPDAEGEMRARLVVCLGDGRVLVRSGVGNPGGVEILDIDRDGRPEIAYTAFNDVASNTLFVVIRRGRLRAVRGPDGHALRAITTSPEYPRAQTLSTWGCERGGLVTIDAARTGRTWTVTRRRLRLDGTRTHQSAIQTRTGRAVGRDLHLPARLRPRPCAVHARGG